MTVIIGFSGTQAGMNDLQYDMVLGTMYRWKQALAVTQPGPIWVHHGDCVGADKQMHDIAREVGFMVHGHPPIRASRRAFCEFDAEDEPLEYLERNREIVHATTVLVATPRAPETLRSGTWSALRYANRCRRALDVFWPDGSWDDDPKHIFTLQRFTATS